MQVSINQTLSSSGNRVFPGSEPPSTPSAPVVGDAVELSRAAGASPSAADAKATPYIITPPEGGKPLSREGLQRLLSQNGLRGSVLTDEIPLTGSITGRLDRATVAFLEKQGYVLISDETQKFILPHPNDQKRQGTHFDDGKVATPPSPEPRPAQTESRFDAEMLQRFTGKGVNIAFLDTGVYPHPDFTRPNDRIVAFVDFVNGRSVPYDDNGHGTHVAGDAAGNGAMSEGLFRGPAPGAGIIGVKVLNSKGGGRTSDILKGINWVIENREKYNIRVLNMSLGNRASVNAQSDPIYQAVDRAVEAGIVVVAAAGNEGPEPHSINTPGDNPNVITVGAYDDNNTAEPSDDRIPDFSSRGPTYANIAKPDILAPGEAIIGPNAPVSPTEEQARKYEQINQTLQWLRGLDDASLLRVPEDMLRLIGLTDETLQKIKDSPAQARTEIERLIAATDRTPLVDTSYVGTPGTSVAAPIVSGVVAEMLEANPELTPAEVKSILRDTARPLPRYGAFSQGAGAINPEDAVAAAYAKSPAGSQMTLDEATAS
ncbi:MAG: hypothetical protein EB084_04935 [Proteobacteria bacterium]|nr:hypothetical protein [Pseudomonadota bacterium]